MKKSALTFLLILFSCMLFAQAKFPLYIFETKSGGFDDDDSRDNVLQLFSDSTFTLTNYWKTGKWFGAQGNKSKRKGRYIKQGDTLFLDDAISRFAVFTKELPLFEILAKTELLQLLPAKIFFRADTAYYVSHIYKWMIKLQKLQFLDIIEIEKLYFPLMAPRQRIVKNPFSPQFSNNPISF